MADYIKTIKAGNDNIYPRTKTSAVYNSTNQDLDTVLATKVDKETGKGLSTNDFSNTEKALTDNSVQGVKLAGTELTKDSDNKVDIPLAHSVGTLTKGVISAGSYGVVATNGVLYSNTFNYSQYNSSPNATFVGKGTLTNVANALGWTTAIKTTLDSVMTVNTQYLLGVQTTVALTLPTGTAGQKIKVEFYSGETATSLSISGSVIGEVPTVRTYQKVKLEFFFDDTNWEIESEQISTIGSSTNYELIETITISSNTSSIERTQDTYGYPYDFKKILVIADMWSTGVDTLKLTINNTLLANFTNLVSDTIIKRMSPWVEVRNGKLFGYFMGNSTAYDTGGTVSTRNLNGNIDANSITQLKIELGTQSFTNGTKFMIYAVR